MDKEILELVELETRDLLNHYGFDGDNCPVITGSALLALKGDQSPYGVPSIKALLDKMDEYFPSLDKDITSPFLFPIDHVFSLGGRGTIVVGTLKRGTIQKGDDAELIGYDQKMKTIVNDCQVNLHARLNKFLSKEKHSSCLSLGSPNIFRYKR